MAQETLNIAEIAQLLHVHEETARELARQGKIPAAKFGRAWVSIRQDLLDAIRSRYTTHDDRCRDQPTGDSRWLRNEKGSGIPTSASTDVEYEDLLKQR